MTANADPGTEMSMLSWTSVPSRLVIDSDSKAIVIRPIDPKTVSRFISSAERRQQGRSKHRGEDHQVAEDDDRDRRPSMVDDARLLVGELGRAASEAGAGRQLGAHVIDEILTLLGERIKVGREPDQGRIAIESAGSGHLADPVDLLERPRGRLLAWIQHQNGGGTVDALAVLGPTFVGVTQLPADCSDEQILELDRSGVRAVRFNLRRGGLAGVGRHRGVGTQGV